MHQEVKLTVKQALRFETVKTAIDGTLTNAEAAAALRLSVRQLQRLKRRVRAAGPVGVVHGNTGREPPNKTPPEVRDQAIELATTRYAAYNFSHLADTLAEDHRIVLSEETLRLWLRPMGHGKAVRRAKAHRRRRKRRAHEGQLLFLDGSPHPWFGDDHPPVCMLLSSDDATSKPLWGKFQPTENRDGCFEVCYRVFTTFGLPGGFYLDRGSQFTTTRHGGLHVRQGPHTEFTAFEVAMETLGIDLIFARSPQARGRGERLNGSFQGRLVAELVDMGIADCRAATRYLNRSFIPRYCRRFGKPPADPAAAWRPVPEGMDLRAVLAVKHTRTVANDTTVGLNGTTYQLRPPAHLFHLARAKVEVQERFDGTVRVLHPEHGYLRATPIADPETSS